MVSSGCRRDGSDVFGEGGGDASILRLPLAKRTIGISSSVAHLSTRCRNLVPILSKIAGDGIGLPRCTERFTVQLRGHRL